MKAQINGIAVEGTPQEIMEFQRLQNITDKLPKPHWPYGWWGIFPPNDSDGITITQEQMPDTLKPRVWADVTTGGYVKDSSTVYDGLHGTRYSNIV